MLFSYPSISLLTFFSFPLLCLSLD